MDIEIPTWIYDNQCLNLSSILKYLDTIRELQIITEDHSIQKVIDTCFCIFYKTKWINKLEAKKILKLFSLLKRNAWLFSKHLKILKNQLSIYLYILMLFEFESELSQESFLILKTLILNHTKPKICLNKLNQIKYE